MELTGYFKRRTTNYKSKLLNIPEDRRPQTSCFPAAAFHSSVFSWLKSKKIKSTFKTAHSFEDLKRIFKE
jgi:hypothetical protein